MEITITKVETVGPTVAVWGSDGKKEVMVQMIDMPPTKDGIFSMLHTALTAPPFEEPEPTEPIEDFEPPEDVKPEPISEEALESAINVKEKYDKLETSEKKYVFEDIEIMAVDV